MPEFSQRKSVFHSKQSPGQKLPLHAQGSEPAENVARGFPSQTSR